MNSMSGGSGYSANIGGRNVERFQQYTPQQMQLHESQFANVGPSSYLSRLAQGDPGLYNQIEGGAKRQFNERLGDISSRFSGMGLGARHGSGFQNTTNQAAADFSQQLQDNRMNLQRQAIQDLGNMSNTILNQKPYEYYASEEEEPWWKTILGEALPIAAGAAGSFFGGPMGGAAAYSASKGIANTVGNKSGANGYNRPGAGLYG